MWSRCVVAVTVLSTLAVCALAADTVKTQLSTQVLTAPVPADYVSFSIEVRFQVWTGPGATETSPSPHPHPRFPLPPPVRACGDIAMLALCGSASLFV